MNIQLQEACKSRENLSPENLFETPPNSLVCNIPLSVLETNKDCTDPESATAHVKESVSARCSDGNFVNLEDENVSDSTLVTSSSQNGSDVLPNENNDTDFMEEKDSNKLGPSTSNPNRIHDLCDGQVSDKEDRYNPPIPVEQWDPIKKPCKKDSTPKNECHNEGGSLPPHEWTATKSHKVRETFDCSVQILSQNQFFSTLQNIL